MTIIMNCLKVVEVDRWDVSAVNASMLVVLKVSVEKLRISVKTKKTDNRCRKCCWVINKMYICLHKN